MPDDQLVTECGGDGKGQSTKHGYVLWEFWNVHPVMA
jgi:hypothetical protein